ncbi:MAG: patatin-like phospholipase family protein [Pirellulales bacterium]
MSRINPQDNRPQGGNSPKITTPAAVPASAVVIKTSNTAAPPSAAAARPQRGFVETHLCAIVVGVLTCGVLVLDQVWHMFDLPRGSGPAQWNKEPATLWIWVYTLGLGMLFALGVVQLFRRTRVKCSQPIKLSHPGLAAGVIVAAGAASLTMMYLSEAFRLSMGSATVLAFAWGGWLLLQGRMHPRVARGIRVLLVAVSLSNILGEVVWSLAFNHPSLVSFRPYTMWIICHILFEVCALARIVDVWQSESNLPIRGVVLASLFIAPLALRSTTVLNVTDPLAMEEEVAVAAPPADPNGWYQSLLDRLDAVPGDQDCPYIFVAASGGGSRAALFTSLVYEHLSHVRIDGNEPDKHVAMISSVSGGSLASAHYVQNSGVGPELEQPTGFTQTEIEDWIDEELRLFHQADSSLYNEYHRAFDKEDLSRYLANAFVVPDAATEAAGTYALSDNANWILRQTSVNDMCSDFMAPLLRGALHPGLERGEACDQFWRTKLGLTRTIDEDGRGDRPLLLCNVTEVAKGSRLVIGFPSLPAGFYSGNQRRYRGLLDLGLPMAQSQMPLSTAVRLSANFPWCFELGVVQVLRGESDAEMVAAIDGAVCDNTGIDTLRYTLASIVAKADETTDENHPARQIVSRLRKRGLIILEIDSGAKPQPPGAVERLFSASIGPVLALKNAAYCNSQFASAEHLAAIEAMLPSDATEIAKRYAWRLQGRGTSSDSPQSSPKVGVLSCVQHVKVQCNHEENVMTAWALGPRDKAKIFVKFSIDAQALSDNLAQCIEQQRHVNEWLSFEIPRSVARTSDAAELYQSLYDTYNALVDESLESNRLAELQGQVRRAVTDDEYYRHIVDQVVVPKNEEKFVSAENPREELDSLMANRIERSNRAAKTAGDRLRGLRNRHSRDDSQPSAIRPNRGTR